MLGAQKQQEDITDNTWIQRNVIFITHQAIQLAANKYVQQIDQNSFV